MTDPVFEFFVGFLLSLFSGFVFGYCLAELWSA